MKTTGDTDFQAKLAQIFGAYQIMALLKLTRVKGITSPECKYTAIKMLDVNMPLCLMT